MKTPEGKVKDAIKAYLKSIGAWYAMPMGTGWGRSGIPDFLVCHRGKLLGIEAKAPGKRGNTTPLQDREIAAIQAAGGIAIVVDDVSQLATILEK
jgi:hypothetical protein